MCSLCRHADDPSPPSLEFDASAKAKLTLTPDLKFGLFGDGGDRFTAEAGIHTTLNLAGQMEFGAKYGAGASSAYSFDPIPAKDSCGVFDEACCSTNGVPYCSSHCQQKHHLQMNFLAEAEVLLRMQLSAEADFGIWKEAFDFHRYLTLDGIVEEEQPVFEKTFHLASICMQPLNAELHADATQLQN